MNNYRKTIIKLHSKSTTPTLTQRLVLAVRGMPSHTEETAFSAPAASNSTCYGEIDGSKPLAGRCDHQTIREACMGSNNLQRTYPGWALSSGDTL